MRRMHCLKYVAAASCQRRNHIHGRNRCPIISFVYDLVRGLLRIAPLVVTAAALALPINRRGVRYAVAFVATWAAVFVFMQFFWDYSIDRAPTWKQGAELARRDGAPRVGSLYFGWIHAFVAICLLEPLFVTARWLARRRRERTARLR